MWVLQESRSKLLQQVQQMQAMCDQQAEEIVRLHASQSSTPQAIFTATIQDQGQDRPGAAKQASAAQQPYSHRAQETPGGGVVPKIASIIRYAQQNSHLGSSVSLSRFKDSGPDLCRGYCGIPCLDLHPQSCQAHITLHAACCLEPV